MGATNPQQRYGPTHIIPSARGFPAVVGLGKRGGRGATEPARGWFQKPPQTLKECQNGTRSLDTGKMPYWQFPVRMLPQRNSLKLF